MAQIVSLGGDWFNTIASVILVNRFTDSGLAVGAIFLARGLPPFILGPVAGVFADRFSRKSIMVATDVLHDFRAGGTRIYSEISPLRFSNLKYENGCFVIFYQREETRVDLEARPIASRTALRLNSSGSVSPFGVPGP